MSTETSIYAYAKQGLAHGADRTAIWFYGRAISYGELFEKIDNVADHLYELGVREGTVVTIHLPNCPQAVMAIYAVAKLGGICNMVYSGLSGKGLEQNLSFVKSSILITYDKKVQSECTILVDPSEYMKEPCGIQSECVEHTCVSFRQFESACKLKGVFPDQSSIAEKCAILLHSSGTTGYSKTVMHCHAAINRIVANTFQFLHCKDFTDQIVLAELPLFHGFGLIDNLHDAISGGGQIVQVMKWDAKYAANLIDTHKITFMAGVPKVYQDLMAQESLVGASLTHCYVGGEPVKPELKTKFNERMGRSSLLYEGYGLAEVIAYCCSSGPFDDDIHSAGASMPGTEIAVLVHGKVHSFGEGELVVHSDTMMLGYLQSFDDPFFTWNNKRWIKTGDYVVIDQSGHMRFVERIKRVIIRNGFNIFPAEIETITLSIDGVSECCVFEGERDQKTRIVVAIVGKFDQGIEDKLKQTWTDNLPPYSVPEDILHVQAIPRTAIGKIDYQFLHEKYREYKN